MKETENGDFSRNISCYVLLNDEPINCKKRVEDCRGNKSESCIPIGYYEVSSSIFPPFCLLVTGFHCLGN